MEPEEILQQIAAIRQMVQGSISPYNSNNAHRTHRNLSSYVGGKTTTHVRPEQIETLQHLINEHRRFRKLVNQYQEAVIRRTRAELGIPLRDPEPEPDQPQAPPAASESDQRG